MCLESIFVKMSQPVIKVCSWLTVCGHLSRYNPSGSPLVQNAWCCTPSRGGSSEDGRWSLHEALDLLWSGGRDSPPLYQSKYWTGLDLKETITRPKDKVQGVCVWEESTKKQIGKQNLTAKLQRWFLLCVCAPAANSSMVMRGKRMSVRALPRTLRLFSGVGCNCCLWASASAQRTAAPNKRTSLTPRVSLSNTATNVSEGGRDEKSIVS